MTIRVLLVDDHTMFREALRLMLDKEPGIEVVGELGDGSQIEETIARLTPGIVVMDVSMPGINGIETTRAVLAKFPEVRVVALSAFGYKQFVMEMLDAGAVAYVVKLAAGKELVRAITNAAQGKTYLCPDAVSILVQTSQLNKTPSPPAAAVSEERRLGQREKEVLRLLAEGKSSPQISGILGIAHTTVDVHRRNIMRKIELHTVAELTKYAIRTGITCM
ncbi:putative Transcriptional regulatory protein DegU [Gammaproteobacteria bacterium]